MERYNFRNIEKKWRDNELFNSVVNIDSKRKIGRSPKSSQRYRSEGCP